MTISLLAATLQDVAITGEADKVEKYFGVELEEKVKRLISAPEGLYDQGGQYFQKLCAEEIVCFDEYFGFNIISGGIIPIFDYCDGYYVSWDIEKHEFCMFCVIDDRRSSYSKSFEDFMGVDLKGEI